MRGVEWTKVSSISFRQMDLMSLYVFWVCVGNEGCDQQENESHKRVIWPACGRERVSISSNHVPVYVCTNAGVNIYSL